MTVSSAKPHLAAIPETASINHLPGSAHTSPRSTSDSPAQGSPPISPTSRLLQPTLSWQAKASWISEPPTTSGTTPMGTEFDAGSRQGQVPFAAADARDQATTASSRLSPSPPSASWQSAPDSLQTSHDATGTARNMATSMVSVEQPSNGLVAQEKADQLTALLQDELAKRGKPDVTPWQQQRLQLRAVNSPSGSPAARSGSPGKFRYMDASVDSLQQQRSKLRPVQTSKHAALPVPVQQGFAAAPIMAPLGGAQVRGVHSSNSGLPAALTGSALAVRAALAAGGELQTAAMPHLVPAAQPVAGSPASQLRTKYGQLTELLQSTALQRGISLSQVPIPPTHKPGKGQQKRVSLEEVRISFRSFTTAYSAAAGGKPSPLRRISTGAITPAFLKEKNKQDKALLESLGVADPAAEAISDTMAAGAASPAWAPTQYSGMGFVDETPAVFTRGKGGDRSTGGSFDINLQHLDETQDEVSSSADLYTIGAAQVVDSHAGPGVSSNGASAAISAAEQIAVVSSHFAAGEGKPVQPSQLSQATELDAQLQRHREHTGDPQAGAAARNSVPQPSEKERMQQAATFNESKKLQMTDVTGDNGIDSSGVKVDVLLAQHMRDKTKDADNTGQQSDGAQNAPKKDVRSTPNTSLGHRICCSCCSTKE